MAGRPLLLGQVLERLSEGGMGAVRKGRDSHLDRFASLSVPPADRRRRFVQGAKAAAALKDPKIITMDGVALGGGSEFIAMESVAGERPDRMIARTGSG